MADDLHVDITVNTTQAAGAVNNLEGNIGDLRTDLLALNETVERFEQGFYQAMSKSARATNQSTQAVKNSSSAWDKQNRIYEDYLYAQDRATGSTLSGKAALDQHTTSLNAQRYALYDLATTYGVLSAAALAASGYVVKVGTDFETAFTGVERTLQQGYGGVDQLRAELVDLSTQIPLTFQEIAKIAQLGNQLGIYGEDVAAFTETVAQFSAVTGITAEETALAFGQLGNLLGVQASEFGNLGSAIALVGVNSAATEKQIVAVAREIAPAARAAGFTADQVIGLSGALASIRVPPERSRSTILQFFETLNMATAEGGQKLEDFATVVGVTVGELESMVRTGQGQSILEGFINTAATQDTVALTQALQNLGLAGLRTNPTIRALSDNTALLQQTFGDAAQGFGENTELARQYALIVDDLASQFMLLVNSVNALIDELTGGAIPGIAALVGGLADAVNGFRQFAEENAWVGVVAQGLAVMTLLVGVIAAVRTAQLLATASTYAFITAQQQANVSGFASGFRGLIGAMLGYTTATAGATVATRILRTALITTGFGAIAVAIGYAVAFLTDFNNTAADTLDQLGGLLDGLAGFVGSIAPVLGGAQQKIVLTLSTILSAIGTFVSAIPLVGEAAAQPIFQASAALLDVANAIEVGTQRFVRISNAYPQLRKDAIAQLRATAGGFDDAATSAEDFSTSLGGVSDSIGGSGGAAAQIRTLVDYANDLQQVFSRSFDIRFGSQSALDAAQSSWYDLAESIRQNERALADLNSRMADYQAQIGQLTADRNVKQYFLEVAELYNDTLRAGVLRADLAKIDQDIADAQRGLTETSEDVADAVAAGSKELNGSGKQAIANRRALLGLVQQYQSYIQALAASGADQATLNAAIAQSEQDFLAQARALGFSDAQLQVYVQSFRDMKVAIDNVPKNVTVTANVNPAIQALNELEAKLKQVSSAGASALQAPDTGAFTKAMEAAAKIAYYQGVIKDLSSRTPIPMSALDNAASQLDYWVLVSKGYYADGGYTGKGGKYEPAGVVHRGEYVTPKKEVNQRTGLPYWMEARSKGYYNGGYVGPVMQSQTPGTRVQLVELVAADKALLHAIAERVGLSLSGTALQNAVTAGNVNATNRGRV